MKQSKKGRLLSLLLCFAMLLGMFPLTSAFAAEDTYTIHFDANDGSGSMEDAKAPCGQAVSLPHCTFTEEYEHFGYWTVGDDFSTQYQDEGFVKDLAEAGGEVTLVAHYVQNRRRVHFNANAEDAEGEMPDQIITQTWGKEIALHLNKFTREGYLFVGWTKDSPEWAPQYKNGMGEGRGKPVGLIPDGFKDYYWTDFKEDMQEVTYYAQWDRYYTVHFDANVPESEYTGEEKDRQFIYGADSWLYACHFKREGFVFAGWNTKADGTGETYDDETWIRDIAGPGEDITLYAQWRPESEITATFIFDGNGADAGSMEPLLAPYGEKVKLPANAFTRAGYKFYRWDSKPDGYGWSFRDQEEIKYGSYGGKESKTITLYAQWVSDKCHFVTVENGNATPRAAEPGTEIALTAKKPHGEDLIFVKWEVTKGEIEIADIEAEETTFVMPDEDVTVKAVYEPIKKIESLELKTDGYRFGAAVKDATVTVTTPGVEVESVTWLELNLNNGQLEETTYPYFWKNITYRVEVFLKVKKGYSADGLKIAQVIIDGETPSYFNNPYKVFDIIYPDTMRVLHEMDVLNPTTYTITVQTDGNGTASASAASAEAGTVITLTAEAAPDGKEFDKWEVVSGNISLEDENSAITTFTMPDEAVSVKATYKVSGGETPSPAPVTATVTFNVKNGTWADGTKAPIEVSVELTDGKGTLEATKVPAGMIADAGYEGGKWNKTPDTTAGAVTGNVTYTYTFTEKSGGGDTPQPAHDTAKITFNVKNGTWADGTTAPRTVEVILKDGKGTLKTTDVPAGMKADKDYADGVWVTKPNTDPDGITKDMTYTYTFTKLDHIPQTGDESSLPLAALLMAASLGMAAALLLLNRKRKPSR